MLNRSSKAGSGKRLQASLAGWLIVLVGSLGLNPGQPTAFPAGPAPAGAPRVAAAAPKPSRTPAPSKTPLPTKTPTPSPTPTIVPSPTATLQPNSPTHPSGCAVGEVYIDSQAWWTNPDGGPGQDFGHLHTSVCWPYLATLDAPLTVAVRSVLHENPGELYALHVQSYDAGPITPVCHDAQALICRQFSPARTLATCVETGGVLAADGVTCSWWDTVTIDPAQIAKSGWQQFRFRGFVREPDGNEMRTSTGLHARVVNNQPIGDYCSPTCETLETRGWYTGAAYANANITAPMTSIVSGIWHAKVQMKAGAGGLPITHHYAAIDTDFHNNNPGMPVTEGSGEFRGTLVIDTTRLSNGWHRLMLKADAFDKSSGSTNSGVLLTWFEVQN